MHDVRLAPFDQRRDLARLAAWLRRPHVAPWWGNPEDALAAVRAYPPGHSALIELDGWPVGFICWGTPSPQELGAAGLSDLPSDLVDVDILIGETDVLGHGVGPEALRLLVARLRGEGVRMVGLAAAAVNLHALKAYDKAGFRPFRDFREGGQDMRYLVQTLDAAV